MIYISSQGGCKGDMCPSSTSSRLNGASSVFFMTGGGWANANAHMWRRSLWVLLQDILLLQMHSTRSFIDGMWWLRHLEDGKYSMINLTPCAELTALARWSISQSVDSFHHQTFKGNQWSSSFTNKDLFSLVFCLVWQLFMQCCSHNWSCRKWFYMSNFWQSSMKGMNMTWRAATKE